MKDITVIIPVHEISDEVKTLFKRAYDSVLASNGDTKIIVVGPKDVLKGLSLSKDVQKVENTVVDLPHQINAAVKEIKTTYFSVLEFDDVYTPIWFKNVEKYMVEYPGCAVYLPIVEVLDAKDEKGDVIGYVNEVTWASSFSQEIGYFDTESLLNFFNICVSGAIFDKAIFDNLGSLKASMRLFYWYEYLLRASNKGRKVFTIPKVGYSHTVNREGSMTDIESKTITPDEFEWWLTLAQQEYQFKTDKNKKYEA